MNWATPQAEADHHVDEDLAGCMKESIHGEEMLGGCPASACWPIDAAAQVTTQIAFVRSAYVCQDCFAAGRRVYAASRALVDRRGEGYKPRGFATLLNQQRTI